jgi:hypothetical protein
MDPALLSAAALALLGAALRVPRPSDEAVPRPLLFGLWAGLALGVAAVFVGGGGLPGQVALLGFGFLAASGRGAAQMRLSGTSAMGLGGLLLAAVALNRGALSAPVAIGPPMLAALALVATGVALNLVARWLLPALTASRSKAVAAGLLAATVAGVLTSGEGGDGGANALILASPFAALALGLIDVGRALPVAVQRGDERAAAFSAGVGLSVAGAAWALWWELLAAAPGTGPAALFVLAALVVVAVTQVLPEGSSRGWGAGALLLAAAILAATWGALPP